MPFKEFEGNTVLFDTDSPDEDAYKALWPSTRDKIQKGIHYAGSELETFCIRVEKDIEAGKAATTQTSGGGTSKENDDDAPF